MTFECGQLFAARMSFYVEIIGRDEGPRREPTSARLERRRAIVPDGSLVIVTGVYHTSHNRRAVSLTIASRRGFDGPGVDRPEVMTLSDVSVIMHSSALDLIA